jgi:hypothetical protein
MPAFGATERCTILRRRLPGQRRDSAQIGVLPRKGAMAMAIYIRKSKLNPLDKLLTEAFPNEPVYDLDEVPDRQFESANEMLQHLEEFRASRDP